MKTLKILIPSIMLGLIANNTNASQTYQYSNQEEEAKNSFFQKKQILFSKAVEAYNQILALQLDEHFQSIPKFKNLNEKHKNFIKEYFIPQYSTDASFGSIKFDGAPNFIKKIPYITNVVNNFAKLEQLPNSQILESAYEFNTYFIHAIISSEFQNKTDQELQALREESPITINTNSNYAQPKEILERVQQVLEIENITQLAEESYGTGAFLSVFDKNDFNIQFLREYAKKDPVARATFDAIKQNEEEMQKLKIRISESNNESIKPY